MKPTEHRRKENHGGKKDVALHVECFMRKKELLDNLGRVSAKFFYFWHEREMSVYFSTNKELQRQCGEHIHTKCEPGDVDEKIILDANPVETYY
jgi:hypothetical protein